MVLGSTPKELVFYGGCCAVVYEKINIHIMRTRLFVSGLGFAQTIAQLRFVRRLLAIIAILALGGVAAQARGPVFNQSSNIIAMAQGTTTNIYFTITDEAVGWSGIQTTTAAFATNGGFSNTILTITNLASPYGPPPSWTNKYSFETNRLTITPGNQFGTNRIVLISVDLWGDSTTNSWGLNVFHVSQPPSFLLATNSLVVLEESGRQTNHLFVSGITNGAGNPAGLTWVFTTTVSPTTATNGGVTYLAPPAITNYNGTNGLTADLVFAPAAHSYGSNLVTVVMTDSGVSAGGGSIAATNTFWLVVSKIVHPPVITGITNETILENGSALANVHLNVTGDSPGSPLGLQIISQNTNLALARVTGTNVIASTNSQFTLAFTPVLNAFGIVTNQLIGSESVGPTTYLTTNFVVLTVSHVSQPPSFSLSTNSVAVLEESGTKTNINFVANLSSGAGNPLATLAQFSLTITTVTNSATNAQFTVLPSLTVTNGILTFAPKPHSFGTNLVTVTLTDLIESTNLGGVKTFSTNFLVKVAQISHIPTITAVASQTTFENGGGTNIVINVWNYDAVSNNLALTAVSAGLSNAPSAVTVSCLSTNVISATNTQFTLHLAPGLNAFGTNVITLTASELVGTVSTSTTNFLVTVAHVTQSPSFVLATNLVTTPEQAITVAITNANFLTAITNGPGNFPGTNWTFTVTPANRALFSVLPAIAANGTLTFTPTRLTNGTTSVVVLMRDTDAIETTNNGGVVTFTNTFTLTISAVSLTPSFVVAPTLTVPEHSGLITSNNFLTGITAGLGNPAGTTWTFAVTSVTNGAGNVIFSQFPSVTTNGTLTFAASDYSFGTNVVTVVMSIINGGLITFTNSFVLQVPWVNQAPSFALSAASTTVDKYIVPVTISNAALNVIAGPPNETNSQTVSLVISNSNPGLFTSQPAIDSSGTLTFTPGNQGGTATLHIHALDTGGTANGGVNVSTNQTLTIVIPTNTFQNTAGTFAGVFYGTNVAALASSGYFNLALDTNGAFNGYLLCGNDSNSFTGQFGIAQSSASVQAGNYTLNLTVNTAAQSIGGSVTNTASNWNSTVVGYLSGYGTQLDGAYLSALPGFNIPKIGSVGDSTFYINIASGTASLTGNLADSTQVTQAGSLCTNGYFPVYIPLYTNSTGANGMLIGWLNFNGVANNSPSPNSILIWISQTNATALYPNGFTNSVAPLISNFDPTQPQILPINKGYVEMSGGTLFIPIVQAVSIVNNQVIVDPAVNDSLSLTINTNTGDVQGSFVDTDGNTNLIESVALQNDAVARGYFTGAGQSGAFLLVANAVLPQSPPYPAFTGITAHGAVSVAGVTVAGITNLVIPENATNDLRLTFSLYDPLTNHFSVVCSSANTNVVSVSLTGSGLQRQLLFATVTNIYGSNITVTVTANDGTLTNSFIINATISYVNHAPSFAVATNAYTVDQYGVVVTAANAITTISAGPPSESWQTVSFIVTNSAPGLFLVQPAVDANGTLTFTPGSVGGTVTVGVQAQDNGGSGNNGADTSASQLVTITIPSNPFNTLLSAPSNTGTFNGLFTDTNAATPPLNSSGYFSLVLTNDGTFAGYLICAGATNAFTGQFSISQSNATVTLANYALNLSLNPGAATINGSVVSTSPSWTATLQSYLATPTALVGNYLVALPGLANPTAGPVGNSTFTVAINSNGVASLTGSMADNTFVSLTSQLSAAGNCPIYLPIYTNNANAGLLFGWLTFTNAAADNLTAASSLTWINNSGATPALYPAGFTNQSVAVASSYVSSAPNELAGISYYAVLTGGSFGTSLVTNAVNIVNDTITVDPSATDGLTLAINEVTGAITGSFVNGGVTNNIGSLILQNTDVASGYFTTASGNQSGSFVLLGNYTVPAGYAYPETAGLTNVTLLENASTFSMAFELFDPLTNNFTSVTASSANPNFVTVSVSGSGTAYTLQITPVTDSFTNSVAVSIVANDGTLISTNTINVTVTWVNQAPTFTLNPTTITVDQFDVPLTLSNAVTAISAGPDNGGGLVNFIVTNNANGLFVTQPAVDTNGTLTFTPGYVGGTITVGVQGHDNRGTANGGVDTSISQTFTIVIPANQFQNITGGNMTGTFTGLFFNTNGVVPSSSGYVTVTLTNDGSFNLNFLSAGATNSVNGQFSISNSTASVAVGSYALSLAIDTVGGTVTGSVTNTAAHWDAALLTYVAATPAITPGNYNVALPGFDDLTAGPTGDSVFTVGINSNGVATLAGFMADNTAVSQVALLSAAGYCPVYVPLYPNGTNGLLIGWLTFTNDPDNDSVTADSSLIWFNVAGATPNLYPAGFTNQAVAIASPYETDLDYTNDLLGSSSSSGYGYVLLSGGDLGANPVVKKVGITNNIISLVSTRDTSVSLTISTNTGTIQGWYIDPKGQSNNIAGAIFQNSALATGYFTGVTTNQSGLFMLFGN